MTPNDSDMDIQSRLNAISGDEVRMPQLSKLDNPAPPTADEADDREQPLTILAELGGLASAREIGNRMSTRPSVRMIRDRLKAWKGVQKIGGGFYKLIEHPSPSLHDWLVDWMGSRRLPVEQVVDSIVREWPHPDPGSIRAWIHQDPERVRHSRGEVWIHRAWRPQR